MRLPGDVERDQLRSYPRLIRLATAGVLAYSVALPLIRLYAIARGQAAPNPGPVIYAVAALVCYLPIQAWLVVRVSEAPLAWKHAVPMAAMAGLIFGVLPAVGVGWVGILYVPAALVLAGLPAPWSYVTWAALVASNAPLTAAVGHFEFASYFTVGMVLQSVTLAVGLWLLRGARQLQTARVALAEQAVLHERQRINRELTETLGVGLEAIAVSGDSAERLLAHDSHGAAAELQALVDSARQALGNARNIVQRYRENSLRAEFETAATLLAAAGIDADFDLAPADPSIRDEDAERARLHHRLAQVLNGDIGSPHDPAIPVALGGLRSDRGANADGSIAPE